MLARQCGRPGRTSVPLFITACSSPRLRAPLGVSPPTNASVWITEECVSRAFRSFFFPRRSVSNSQQRCEFNSEDYSRRLLRRRMSLTRLEPGRTDQFDIIGASKWDETPPTFSWSREQLPRIGIGSDASDPGLAQPQFRPKGVHYQIGDTGSVTSRFLSSIFQPIATFFPTTYDQDAPPPPPPPLSIATPSSFRTLAVLEEAIFMGEKSVRWILSEHKKLKAHAPYLQLSSRAIVSLFRRLLGLGMYKQFLQVIEREDLVAMEGVDLVKLSLEQFDNDKRRTILEDLGAICETEHRARFRGMLEEMEKAALKDLHEAVLKETSMMLSHIMGEAGGKPTEEIFAKGIDFVKDVKTLCDIVNRVVVTRTKIGIKTSQAIFQRFIELEGLEEAAKYALNPKINVPGTNNIAALCMVFCEEGRYDEGYRLIMAALEVNLFGFLSDQDVLVGIRTVDKEGGHPEGELIALWEALNASKAISIRDVTKDTFSAFIGRACRLKFGTKAQWAEGDGSTLLLKMCIEIIVLRLRGEAKTEHLCTLIETWVWNWRNSEMNMRIDTNTLNQGIPFMPNFLGVLSPEKLDEVFTTTIHRVIANCLRRGDEVWPVRVLWPFVASVAQNKDLWTNEESVALWVLEGVVLRKGLASKYLAFRTDPEIARFVVRHYLPFRVALESPDDSQKERAKSVFFQLKAMDTLMESDPDIRSTLELGLEADSSLHMGPFATAILAFRGTGIPCRTLLLDMVYTLLRLQRPDTIVHLLQNLNPHAIRPSSSQYAYLVRTLTRDFPEHALQILKIYAKSQYSTFATYIATVAAKYPYLALNAYHFLTKPHRYAHTPDQPDFVPRRQPRRRLLVAMAWKFANSPALTPRQCHRWVHRCYGTMLMLGYSPGPTVGLAIAIAAVQRAIKDGVPVRFGSARQKWVVQAVKRQAGARKAREIQEILLRYESRRRERAKYMSVRW